MSDFYKFMQNNSGGVFDVNDNVSVIVIIEAENPEQALSKLDKLTEDGSSSCPCCGDRWGYIIDDVDKINLKENQTIEEYADTCLDNVFKESPGVILHYLNGEKRKFYHQKRGEYKND